MLSQILGALQEIKVQNNYLVERNAELEYLVERDLKPRISDGFLELKSDIQSLKKSLRLPNAPQYRKFRVINGNPNLTKRRSKYVNK